MTGKLKKVSEVLKPGNLRGAPGWVILHQKALMDMGLKLAFSAGAPVLGLMLTTESSRWTFSVNWSVAGGLIYNNNKNNNHIDSLEHEMTWLWFNKGSKREC